MNDDKAAIITMNSLAEVLRQSDDDNASELGCCISGIIALSVTESCRPLFELVHALTHVIAPTAGLMAAIAEIDDDPETSKNLLASATKSAVTLYRNLHDEDVSAPGHSLSELLDKVDMSMFEDDDE